MPRKPRISLDQGVKELLQLRPKDAFAFLLPDIHERRGDPCSWEFLATQVRKKDLRGKGYVMDLSIRYTFAEGFAVLLVLVEHWSEARKIDLVRTAHYYLDLMERFPKEQIVPVALITERIPHDVPDSVIGSGDGEEFLRFRTRVIQLAQEDARRWAATSNLVATTFLLAMRGSWDSLQKLLAAADSFQGSATDEEAELLFPLFVELGKLKEDEEETIMSYLATMPKPRLQVKIEEMWRKRGLEEGRAEGRMEGRMEGRAEGRTEGHNAGLEEGLRQKAREDARRMLDEGFAWNVVTRITGVVPEDLKD